jgi:uncharacterized protein YdgA (DUF945 family)
MKKIALALAIATPFVAFPAASWVIGGQIDSIFERQYAQLKDNPFVDIVERKTQRGIFSTDEVTTFALKPEFTEQFEIQNAGAPVQVPPKPVQFVVRTRINHGPMPAFSGIGLASAHSELELDNPLIKKLYAGKSPLTVDTQIDFAGAGREQVRSPAVEGSVDGIEQLAWGELAVDIDFNNDFSVWNMQGVWPFLKARGTNGSDQFEMKGLAMEGRQTRLSADKPDLYTGPFKISLQSFESQSRDAERPPMLLEKLVFKSDVKESAGFIDVFAGYEVNSMRVGEQVFRAAHFDLALRHLESAALADLNKVSNSMNSSSESMDMEQIKPLLRPLQVLLENSPEIAIERMGMSTPQGDIKASALVRLPNANVGNLETAAENPMLLMSLATVLQADAQIALPEVLLRENLTAQQTEMLAAMVQAGYVLNKSGQLSTALSYAQGNLTVNGQPLNPAMMGMQ